MARELKDVIASSRSGGRSFEAEVEDEHLAKGPVLSPELKVFSRAFKFTPVEYDPFPKLEPSKKD